MVFQHRTIIIGNCPSKINRPYHHPPKNVKDYSHCQELLEHKAYFELIEILQLGPLVN